MWKVATAVLLLTSSAFGAPLLSFSPSSVAPVVGSPFDVDLRLAVDPSNTPGGLYGLSAFLYTDAPAGAIQLTDRSVVVAPLITDLTRTNASLGLPYSLPAVYDSNKDLGSTTTTLDPLTEYNGTYLTLTFRANSLPAAGQTWKIELHPIWSDYHTLMNLEDIAVTITPEPASIMLLAAGAVLFARRSKR